MIVVRLMGGLGNQMFQYAAGKSLAVRYNTDVFVDVSHLNIETEKVTKRKLELDQLSIDLKIAAKNVLENFAGKGFIQRLLPGKTKRLYNERQPTFDKDFYKLGGDVYLNGFWQSEQYFKSIRTLLLKEFSPGYAFDQMFAVETAMMGHGQSVSIHVRRGDYVELKNANEFHGVCGIDYYNKAIEYMREQLGNPTFFVFSDDIAWCRQNIRGHGIEFVFTGSTYNSADMLLMSICRHHIIANSSYSWWAAWLGDHADKIVIAPKNWVTDINHNSKDIYCTNWIKL